ncbi:helix-turn-helix transcriptional regulator [Enterobacter asburiae]|uniref:helix-turn-helix transcriptional regulator n=1 Tax=Scandinavium sp. UTDF21-P1B TaxID=3446379 RepID=UPI00346FA3CD
MKSIYDIRRENLNEIIRRDYDDTQLRLAEHSGFAQTLVNRWSKGTKNIGTRAARDIEKSTRRPEFWMDIDHSMFFSQSEEQVETGDRIAEKRVANALSSWMAAHPTLNSEKRVSEAVGVSQSTVHRILHAETSATLSVLSAIAAAFGREVYEMVMPPAHPALIRYDHAAYSRLSAEDKSKITSFIEFVLAQQASN